MNDPGSDGQIESAAKANNEGPDNDWQEEREEEDTLLKPSRWWMASTACPLIAGTFGPMATAFNICALIEYWREIIPSDSLEGDGTLVKDPAWLIGVNGVSLAFAIFANAALLLNMVGRASFSIAQPITIVGFYSASIILIALVITANTDVLTLDITLPGATESLTAAYYFACFAAGIYFIIASLCIFTVYGAMAGKYEKKFQITTSQRTLMLQTISFMAYILIGAAVYSHLEGWRYNDAIYWSSFTLLTIGIGDNYVPATHAGRTLVIFYTFGGILSVGLVISSIRSMLLEKGAAKLHARAVEKKRQKVDSLADAEWKANTRWRLGRKAKGDNSEFSSERQRRYREFTAMRKIQDNVATYNQYRSLAISSFNAAALWFFGALVFFYSEASIQQWTYFDALYFSWTTLITLGYGDFQPLSNAGKAFFVFWSLLAIPTLTVLISDMSDTVVKGISEATNYLGSLTIAPGDPETFKTLRKNLNKFSGGLLFKKETAAVRAAEEKQKKNDEEGRVGLLPELLNARFTDAEKRAIDEFAATTGESLHERDIHFYHYVLVKEIKNVLADTLQQPPKRYTYDEWAYYLKMLGHDEDDPAYHREGHGGPHKDAEDAPQVGRILTHDENPAHWSWLSLRSPLVGLGTEADWILKRLLNKLHGELKFQGKPGRGSSDHPPPFSISAVRGHATGHAAHEHPSGLSGSRLKEVESTFGG